MHKDYIHRLYLARQTALPMGGKKLKVIEEPGLMSYLMLLLVQMFIQWNYIPPAPFKSTSLSLNIGGV